MNFPQRIIRPSAAFQSTKTKRPRIEDRDYLNWIRSLPCLITGRRDHIEAAHIRYADAGFAKREVGKGEKADDRWSIPLHQSLHREQHDHGNERDWWIKQRIDPLQVCLALYHIRGDDELAEIVLREARERRIGKR